MGNFVNHSISVVSWSLGIARHHPGPLLCSMIFMIGFTMISSNALFSQQGAHPKPLWETRDHTTTQSVPTKSGNKIQTVSRELLTLAPENLPVPAFKPSSTDNSASGAVTGLVAGIDLDATGVQELQRQLIELNLYDGPIDGQYGGGTKSAVLRLQSLLGMQATGLVDEELTSLLAIRTQNKQTAQISKTEQSAEVQSFDEALVKSVQIGLRRFGADGIEVDGIYGSQTASAIRAFQERYELKIDGMPTKQVLNKLRDIGALSNT